MVQRVQYDNAYTFIYSKRTGTPAAAMENQVPEAEVKSRFDRLLSLVQENARARTARFADTVQEVLIEEVNEHDPSLLTGRMSNNLLVHFPGDAALMGSIRKVRLNECRGFYYMGTLISD